MPSEREISIIIRAKNLSVRTLRAVSRGLVRMGRGGRRVARVMSRAFKSLGRIIKGIGGLAVKAAKLMLIPIAGLTVGFTLAVREAGKFQQGMANVASVLGATAEEMIAVENAALEMGRTSVFTAREATGALYDLASAGLSANQSVAALKGTMLLSAATASDLTFTTETVTATLKQFGLAAKGADRISNVFAAAISFSKLNMDRLATSISFAGPVAAGFGHKLEATVAVLAQFANLGLRASMIGTTFRQGLLKLTQPGKRATAVLARMGLTLKALDPQTNSVADIIEKLHGKVKTMSDAVALFGVRAGGPFLKLIQAGVQPLRAFEKRITGTTKAIEMAKIQTNTFFGALKFLKSAIQGVAINLGKAFLPALTKMVKQFTVWINKIGEINWVEWWAGFTSSAENATSRFNQILDLFRSGGAFRTAILEWGKFFLEKVSAFAKIIWLPLLAELKIVLLKIVPIVQKSLGNLFEKIGFGAQIGGIPLPGAPQIQRFGVGLQQRALRAQTRAPEEALRIRAETQRNLTKQFGRLLTGGPERAVKSTTELINQVVSIAKGAEGLSSTAQKEREAQQTFYAQVINSFGKLQDIYGTSIEQLRNESRRLNAKIVAIENLTRKSVTVGDPLVGAIP